MIRLNKIYEEEGELIMNINEIQEKAKSLMIKSRIRLTRETGYSYFHGLRVANLAVILRKHLFPNITEYDDIIRVAGFFHDIAKNIEPHSHYGAILTREALMDMCTKEELDLICECIINHEKKGIPNNYHFTSRLIQDADAIDWMGANNIWIELYAHVTNNSTSEDYLKSIDYFEGESAIFNYDISKKIFLDRIKFRNEYTKRIMKELSGEIYNSEKFGL